MGTVFMGTGGDGVHASYLCRSLIAVDVH